MRLLDPFIAAALTAGLLTATTVGARAETYFVNQWPQDIGKVPCEAWRKNPDGSWTQAAQIRAGVNLVANQNYKAGSGEARMLGAKCKQ